MLDDDDIVSLVNVKFLTDYHRTTSDRVIALRGKHGDFVAVHTEVSRGRDIGAVGVKSKGKGRGKGKGEGKGH